MPAMLSTPSATRLRKLLVLLLLSLGLLAGVSVSQTHALHAEVVQAETLHLPALKRVHELQRQIDEQRGMAALHLTLADEAARYALEGRLEAGRRQIQQRMLVLGRAFADDADRAHHRAVAESLAAFWTAQDRLLAASRRAAVDPDALPGARALLTGDAQQAFLALRARIDAWWTAIEDAAAHHATQARSAAHHALQTVWALGGIAALGLAFGWALLRWPQRPAAAPGFTDGAALQALLQRRLDPHLQALNAAVAAARRGEPGRAAGLSAQEALQVADQVAAAARGLRRLIDRPLGGDRRDGRVPDTVPGAADDDPAPLR